MGLVWVAGDCDPYENNISRGVEDAAPYGDLIAGAHIVRPFEAEHIVLYVGAAALRYLRNDAADRAGHARAKLWPLRNSVGAHIVRPFEAKRIVPCVGAAALGRPQKRR